jgi:arylsulfatase A-like enzyme
LGRSFDRKTLSPPTTGISRNDYAANFAEFLTAASAAGAPWCFWLGAIEPHRPYESGSGVSKGGHALSEWGRLPAYWPDDDRVRADLFDYALEVEYFDQQLQRVLQILAAHGAQENSLVVVTSDNGMSFPRVKGECYDSANRVPLAIRWPEGTRHPGRTVDDYVSLIDMAPTILAVAGVEWASSGMAPATGRSLLPLLAASRGGRVEPSRDFVLLGRERNAPGRPLNQGYPVRAIVRDDWLYLENAAPDRWPGGNPEMGYLAVDTSPTKSLIISRRRANGSDPYWDLAFAKRGPRELYDLKRDPDCVLNCAPDPAMGNRLADLQTALRRALIAQGDPRQHGRPDYFDAFPFSYPPYNDFYERWRAGKAKIRDIVPPEDIEPQPLGP